MEKVLKEQAIACEKTKRKWIYAKKPSGKLYNYRQWVGYSLLLFLFAAPFVKINGNPFLLFNIIERKFSIFGSLFYPQDFHIFVFASLIFLVFIVLFTVVYGRVWCGWACPQTIFMELVFRKIEYWIEGDWQKQKKLNEGEDTDRKAWKKLLKHSVFFAVSFLISNIFLAYIVGIESLKSIMLDPLEQHIIGFISILVFALLFYGVFAFVREIVCTTICPYGRLQGVLLDDRSLTVAYDEKRGEPRGKLQRDVLSPDTGDCIDCKLCVHVCPTGIDIRQGLQMECVNCTACIDACDAVMEKINKPKRLIGFYAVGELNNTDFKKSNSRNIFYSVILVALLSVFFFMIFDRAVIGTSLLRATGSTYQLRSDGTVSNLYTLEVINKSGDKIEFELLAEDRNIDLQLVNSIRELEKDGTAKLSFFLISNPNRISTYKTDIKVNVLSNGKVVKKMKTTFIGPPALK